LVSRRKKGRDFRAWASLIRSGFARNANSVKKGLENDIKISLYVAYSDQGNDRNRILRRIGRMEIPCGCAIPV
jgi:hypothetical protein